MTSYKRAILQLLIMTKLIEFAILPS